MDNQKSNDGNARHVGSEGSGSSMGKDLSKESSFNKGVPSNLDKSIDKTASDAHENIDKAADAAQPMADRLATSAHAGVDKVRNSVSGVTGAVDEKTRQLTDAYGKFANTGREYVRTSPATSILVALAAGFTLAKLFGGRR